MQDIKKTLRVAAVAAAALSLAGCGLFKSTGSGGKYEPNDPNRTVASMVANLYAVTTFDAADKPPAGTYKAILRDSNGNQFYGPKVQLDGKDVTPESGLDTSTQYLASGLTLTTGQTHTTTVQGHSATSAALPPPVVPTGPQPATSTDDKGNVTVLTYYNQPLGEGANVTWTGGDPAQPVYIFIEDLVTGRRLFMKEDPAAAPNDPQNFGLPIPNTGSYAIPAQVTQRVVENNGTIDTKTLTVFNNTNTDGSTTWGYKIYVVQRQTTTVPPISFTIGSQAVWTAVVPAPKKS